MEYIYYKGRKIEHILPDNEEFPRWIFDIHPDGFYSFYSNTCNTTIDMSQLSDLVKYINYFEKTDTITIPASSAETDWYKLHDFSMRKKNWGYVGDTARVLMDDIKRAARKAHDNKVKIRMTAFERQVYLKAINQ